MEPRLLRVVLYLSTAILIECIPCIYSCFGRFSGVNIYDRHRIQEQETLQCLKGSPGDLDASVCDGSDLDLWYVGEGVIKNHRTQLCITEVEDWNTTTWSLVNSDCDNMAIVQRWEVKDNGAIRNPFTDRCITNSGIERNNNNTKGKRSNGKVLQSRRCNGGLKEEVFIVSSDPVRHEVEPLLHF